MPLSPIVIAQFLISEFGPLHRGDLQKLVYFAHGEYLGVTGDPLIDEEPEAWVSGPVFLTLDQACEDLDNSERAVISPQVGKAEVLPDQLQRFLRVIYSKYGHLYGGLMSAVTHKSGSPWHQMTCYYLKSGDEIPRGLTIPNRLIEEEYKFLASKFRNIKADEN